MTPVTHLRHLALHTWAGIVAGLVLFVLLASGSVAVFRHELAQWQRPADRQSRVPESPRRVGVEAAVREQLAAAGGGWVTEVHVVVPTAWHPDLDVTLHVADAATAGGERHAEARYALGADGTPRLAAAAPQPGVAGMLFDLHARLHLPAAVAHAVLGAAAMAMLVLVVTGVVIHRRLLLRNLFTLRPHGSPRVAWTDLHNLLGVWALPFHFVIAVTAIPFALHTGPWLTWMTAGPSGGKVDAANVGALFERRRPPASGTPARTADLDAILADAARRDPGFRPGRLTLVHPDDAAARVEVTGFHDRLASPGPVKVYDGRTGAYVGETPDPFADGSAAGSKLFGLLLALHAGDFGGWLSRGLWFALGVAGAVVAASGQMIWVERRRQAAGTAAARRRYDAMARLTTGVCAGFALAAAAALAAWPLAQRAGWADGGGYGRSGWVFGITWLAATAYAFVRPVAARAGTELVVLSGIALALAPASRWLASGDHAAAAWASGRHPAAVLDLGMLAVGILLAATAWRVARVRRASSTPQDELRPAPARAEASRPALSEIGVAAP